MKKIIILLTGKPGCGKDTVANILSANQINHLKLADPLMKIMYAMFPNFNYEYNIKINNERALKESPNEVFLGKSYRECMIWLAEECIKPKFGKDFFINNLLERIDNSNFHMFVVSDLGFKNDELSHIDPNKYNVAVVKVTRDNLDNIKDSREDINDDIFFTIDNNGSIEDLKLRCSVLMSMIEDSLPDDFKLPVSQ